MDLTTYLKGKKSQYDTDGGGELGLDEFKPMMLDLLSHTALFDGLEKWHQLGENEEQLKVPNTPNPEPHTLNPES